MRGHAITPQEIVIVKRRYDDRDLPLDEIASLHGRSLGWLQHLARREGWPRRGSNGGRTKMIRRKFPDRTPGEVARIGAAYTSGAVPVRVLCDRFKMRQAELYMLIKREGWPGRGNAVKLTALGGPKPRTVKQIILETRAEDAERREQLYGAFADDVDYLRRRNFTVTRGEGDVVMIDYRPHTFKELRDKADRERRFERAPA